MQKRTEKLVPKSPSTVLGRGAFTAISVVEGLKLSPAGRERVGSGLPMDQRRAKVLQAYTKLKERK